MGLLTIPKKYNPPGNGKRDMEYPIFATKQEMGLLKMRGGSGKMTRHGIRSFGLGDKGNSVGSAGGSNYSGDGQGGQVNLDSVGGKTGNVLRNIAGKWTIVDKATGAVRDSEGRAISSPVSRPQVQYTPAAAPVQTVATPIKLPSIPASTLAAQYGMYKNPTANMPATTTATASYPNSMPGNVNQSLNYGPGTSSPTVNAVSPLGMGGTRGSWSSPASPSPNSMPGNSDPGLNYGPGTTPSTLQGMGGARGSWATPSRPPNNTPSTPTSNGPQTRGQMPNYGAGPAVDPGMSNNASYFGDVSDFQGSTPPRTAITSMLAEAQRRAAANRLQEQYSQYRSPPGSPMAPGGLDRYADMTTGGKFGAGSTQLGMTPPAPQAVTDPYGGMGKMGMLSGQTSPYNQPASIAPDPQMAGRLAETRLPGYGVPDLPQRGQVVAKTPGERVNLPSSGPQQVGNINDMLGGLNSGWNEDQIASQISYPSEEGQIYGPASLANYNQPKIADRVPQYADPAQERASIVNQWRQNQMANNSIPRGNLNPATPPVNAGMGPTYGPETPAGPEGWQRGDAQIDPTSHYSPQVQTTASKIQGALDAIGQGLLDNTPGGRLVKGGMWLGDQLSGGPAYRDDVSLGTDNSGRRTDRAPSGNSYSPGGFGPGGGDRRGGFRGGGTGKTPHPKTDDSTTPPPVTPPVTPPPVNMAQWFYPQYQSLWAGLPVGLGGTYGRA